MYPYQKSVENGQLYILGLLFSLMPPLAPLGVYSAVDCPPLGPGWEAGGLSLGVSETL